MNEKKGGEKEEQESGGTPESDENVPGDREFLNATIYPLIGGRRGNERGTMEMAEGCLGGVFGRGEKKIDGIARESFITIPSILQFAASRLRQRAVVNRFERFARLQIVIFPRGKTR